MKLNAAPLVALLALALRAQGDDSDEVSAALDSAASRSVRAFWVFALSWLSISDEDQARAATAVRRRWLSGRGAYPGPAAGRVHVVFHTYDGFLAWFTQTRHEAYLPPDQARLFLNRSVRYTLTWGLLCAGALLVLPLTLFNYLAQRRSISRQELDAAFRVSPEEPTQLDVVEFVDE